MKRTKITTTIDAELWKRLRIEAIKRRTHASKLLDKFISKGLKEK